MSTSADTLARKVVTVLFCDVVGSTSLGERVDPETTRHVMLRYFDETRTVLERHGGTVEKFIGDAVMAVFGVPLAHEDDAMRAVRAANELRTRLGRLNGELEARWGVELQWRIGVNTGEVVVGDPVGTQTIASGDTVNVAARLQQAAQPGDILLGHETQRLVRGEFGTEPLESFPLKGKSDEVRTWRLEDVRAGADRVFRRLSLPLVGRGGERRILHDVYRLALEEQACRLVTLVGPPGIGKTRLAQEVTARLFGATVASGRCLPYGDGIAFSPLAEIVRTLAGVAAEDAADHARSRIAALMDGDTDAELVVDRVAGVIGLGPESRADEAFWALRRLFESVGRSRPLVLLFEDVHWAEGTLLDFIEYLVGWSRGAPTFVLCLARPELLEERNAWPGTLLTLDPLGDDEVQSLVENVLGSAGIDAGLEGRIKATAEGNPLFVQELVYMLLDEGSLIRCDGGWKLADPNAEIAMPPTIGALLAARLDLLDRDERAVLQSASVIGKEFWWSAVVDLAPDELRSAVGTHLHSLVRKRLVFPSDSGTLAGEDSFRFGHGLVRDAAYSTLPKTRRADLHVRFADWLECRSGTRPVEWDEIAGYHLEQAVKSRLELGPSDEQLRALAARAGDLLRAAARRALAQGTMPVARRLLERALPLIDDERCRIEVQLELVDAARQSGDFAAATAVLDSVEESADVAGEGLAARATLERVWLRQAVEPVPLDEVATLIERAIDVYERLDDDAGLAYAWTRMAEVDWRRCRFADMEKVLERALAHAERAGSGGQERTRILGGLGRAALLGPRPVPDAIARCESIRERAGQSLALLAAVDMILAVLHSMTGAFDESRRLLGRSRTRWADLGHKVNLAGLEVYAGIAELIAGEPELAAADLRRGYAAVEEMGEQELLSTIAALLARAELFGGDRIEADRLTRVSEETAASDDIVSQALWRGTRARLAAAEDAVAAEELAREAVELALQTDFLSLQGDMLLDLAHVLACTGRADAAATTAAQAAERFALKGDAVSARRARELAPEPA